MQPWFVFLDTIMGLLNVMD